jgi:zinc finger CCHC domain-containing protein 8
LDWLEEFVPGEIRGQLLQSALAESNEEWLKNICAWGYPPGWISMFDPRERVRDRIWNEDDGDKDSLSEDFEIHGEEDAVEHVSFHGGPIRSSHESGGNVMENKKDVCRDDLFSNHILPEDSHSDTRAGRWAAYPNSYFSSEFLFQYIKSKPSLPPSWDDTPFHDTMAYLNQFHVQHDRSLPSRSSDSMPPPPPLESPPPLPPIFPPRFSSHGPPTLPSSRTPELPIHSLHEVESDMELSDDD